MREIPRDGEIGSRRCCGRLTECLRGTLYITATDIYLPAVSADFLNASRASGVGVTTKKNYDDDGAARIYTRGILPRGHLFRERESEESWGARRCRREFSAVPWVLILSAVVLCRDSKVKLQVGMWMNVGRMLGRTVRRLGSICLIVGCESEVSRKIGRKFSCESY